MDSDNGAKNLANLDENNNRWTLFVHNYFPFFGHSYIDIYNFIKKDSCGFKGDNLEHFCIIGTNSIIDILLAYGHKYWS